MTSEATVWRCGEEGRIAHRIPRKAGAEEGVVTSEATVWGCGGGGRCVTANVRTAPARLSCPP